MSVILSTFQSVMETMSVQGSLSIVHKTPISKTNTANWNGDVAQVEKHLICTHDIPSSNPISIKKNMCVCLCLMHVYIHTSIQTYIYVCVYTQAFTYGKGLASM
jgi:hypothetical protein